MIKSGKSQAKMPTMCYPQGVYSECFAFIFSSHLGMLSKFSIMYKSLEKNSKGIDSLHASTLSDLSLATADN